MTDETHRGTKKFHSGISGDLSVDEWRDLLRVYRPSWTEKEIDATIEKYFQLKELKRLN